MLKRSIINVLMITNRISFEMCETGVNKEAFASRMTSKKSIHR